MPTVVVAGGPFPTNGRAITTALLAFATHHPIILSRSSPDPSNTPATRMHGVDIRCVDYASLEYLTAATKDVETIISVIKIPGPGWAICQLNLLEAAKQAGVKRFASSEFELGDQANGTVDLLGIKPGVWRAGEKKMVSQIEVVTPKDEK